MPNGMLHNPDVLKLKIEPPEHAATFWEDIHGMRFWKNQKNGYTVAAVHFSADPEKNSIEWFSEATRNLTQDKIDQEYHISFESKAGKRVFPYLSMNPGRWYVPPREIKKNETIIASLDFGSRNPTAIHFHAIDHRGRFHTFSEFYKPSTPSEIARWLKNHPYWNRCLKVVADPSIFNSNQHDLDGGAIKSIGNLLEELGIYNLERGENDRIAGLQRMKEMLRYQEAQSLDPYWSISSDCPKLWWELCGLTYRENTDKQRLTKNEDEDVVKKDDHGYDSCFVRGTIISTNRGKIPIESVAVGDLALTRKGYKQVMASGLTGIKETMTLYFSNGASITCTQSHPIFTKNRGFVRADELRYSDVLLEEKWLKKKLFLTVLFLGGIRIQKILPIKDILGAARCSLKKALDICIMKYGRNSMGQFLKDFMYTTEMAIRSITTFPILNFSTPSPTYHHTVGTQQKIDRTQSSISSEFRTCQKSGTVLKTEKNGTPSTLRKFGPAKEKSQSNVNGAVSNMNCMSLFQRAAGFVDRIAGQPTVEHLVSMTLRPLALFAASCLRKISTQIQWLVGGDAVVLLERASAKIEPVYNLTVDGLPEYFANSILVHNCRYGLLSWNTPSELPDRPRHNNTWTVKELEEEIDEKYAHEESLDSYF